MQTNKPDQPTFLASSRVRTADAVAKPRGPLVGLTKDEMRALVKDLKAPFKTPAMYRTRQDSKMEAAAEAATMRPDPHTKLWLHRPKGGTVCRVFAEN